jgi:tetratricopeptide (TPR) repeat protein
MLIVALIAAGAAIQARAASSASGDSNLKAGQAQGFVTEERALLQEFRCAIAVTSLQLSLAEEECTRAIAFSPQDPIGYKYRGLMYLLEHRFEKAEADLMEATTLYPQDAESQAGYAQALSGQGRFDEAVARFGVALTLSPADVRFLGARCWARAAQGEDYRAALADCNYALKLDPDNAMAYDSRGLTNFRSGQYREAIRDYSKSLSIQADRASALFGRALAELKTDDGESAAIDIRKAREIDPEVDDIFIVAGALQEGCRMPDGPCDLPAALRAKPARPESYLAVSQRYDGLWH